MTSAKYTLLLLLSVFVSALSQILLKKSALKSYKSRIFEYLNPLVITAYIMFFGAVCIDLVALRFVPVSFVPVIETSSYIFALLLYAPICFSISGITPCFFNISYRNNLPFCVHLVFITTLVVPSSKGMSTVSEKVYPFAGCWLYKSHCLLQL